MGERVLIVDDEREACRLLEEELCNQGFELAWHTDARDALERMGREAFDVVIADLAMPCMGGIEFCERIAADHPDVPVVVVTAFATMERVIDALRAGAYDFLSKPYRTEELLHRLRRALQHRWLREQVRRLESGTSELQAIPELLGESEAMTGLRHLIAQVIDSDSPVLVTGETGTGKELVARSIHTHGPRRAEPFVAVNSSALPELLLESELFGHRAGAFTDARGERRGLMLGAGKGVFFLDEIEDLPLPLQPKLLRVLQERRIRPVGADSELLFEARVIAASSSRLETAVQEGRFRADLWFRLDVLRIEVPPLRERGSDVLLLAQHFVRHFASRAGKPVIGLCRAACERLLDYPWPGNVRELQNCMERAVTLTRKDRIVVEDLPERVRSQRGARAPVPGDRAAEFVPLDVVETRHVRRVLEAVAGNKALAARILQINRKTLQRKLQRPASQGA